MLSREVRRATADRRTASGDDRAGQGEQVGAYSPEPPGGTVSPSGRAFRSPNRTVKRSANSRQPPKPPLAPPGNSPKPPRKALAPPRRPLKPPRKALAPPSRPLKPPRKPLAPHRKPLGSRKRRVRQSYERLSDRVEGFCRWVYASLARLDPLGWSRNRASVWREGFSRWREGFSVWFRARFGAF